MDWISSPVEPGRAWKSLQRRNRRGLRQALQLILLKAGSQPAPNGAKGAVSGEQRRIGILDGKTEAALHTVALYHRAVPLAKPQARGKAHYGYGIVA